jgi:gliding motility-associated-like protein
MRRLIYLLALWAPITSAQCDVELTNVNWETGDVQIVVHNSENCGIWWGVPWIDHLDIGISNGVDTLAPTALNFPLHSFLDFQEQHFNDGNGDYAFTGDTLNFNLADALNADINDTTNPLTVYERWMEWYSDGTFCEEGEIFIWQINYSNAPQVLNPDWYNPFGTTQDYPDVNPWNNILPIDGLCPCDTVYVDIEVIEYLTDTIIEYVDVEWITTDTIYITETITEYDTITLIETEYVDVIIDNYVYITDTITEFLSITTYVDCETGEECGELSPCDETSIYAPNVVTPNDDGWNDTWQVIADGACWDQWEVRIYNRWGGLVWISASSTDEWEGNVATGLYVYTITAHSANNASIFQFNGNVTVLY